MKHFIAPQRLNVVFDDGSLIANAGMLPAVLLLQDLDLGQLTQERLTLGNPAANPNRSDKLLSLICSSLAGGDCIEDADVLRSGDTARILGFKVKAPSTLGTFLRAFRWHNVRQLDAVSRIVLKRAWGMGAGPGDQPLVIDVDSTLCETYGSHKQGARDLTYIGAKGYHPLIASIGGSGEILHVRMREGRAFTGRGAARFVAEAISRARYAGARGPITVRADAGFYSDEFTAACRRSGARFLSYRPQSVGSVVRVCANGARTRLGSDTRLRRGRCGRGRLHPVHRAGQPYQGATDHAPGPSVYGTAA